MVFNDAPVLRTETELFIRFDEITANNLIKCTILQGINFKHNRPGGAVPTEEVIYLANEAPITNFLTHSSDAVYIIGSFQILTNYKTNIISLNTVFHYEFFYFRYMYPKLVLKEGEAV